MRLSPSARPLVAVALSLALHGCAAVGLALVVVLGLLSTPGVPTEFAATTASAASDEPLEIEALVDELKQPDEHTLAELRRLEEKKRQEEQKRPSGQVVDLAKPALEQRPEQANFVSEYDSKVDRETRGAAGLKQAGGRAAQRERTERAGIEQGNASVTLVGATSDRSATGKPTSNHPEHSARLEPSPARDESLHPDSEGERAPQAKSGSALEPPSSGATPGPSGAPNRPSLLATREILEHATAQGAGSPDYLRDVDDGDETSLNSKKWKHAAFFNRIKRAVAVQWHPDLVYIRHDPSGNVYGVKDRVTVLRVQLSPDGKLAVAPTVSRTSGVDFLDDEAIDAFKRAQPFPNPPKELIEGDGQIHFTFGFIFELSGRTKFRLLQ